MVDDASTDGTEEVVKAFNDSRIRYIRHKIKEARVVQETLGLKMQTRNTLRFWMMMMNGSPNIQIL